MRTQPPPRAPIDHSLRVLIACDHASATYGGEAILPLHYFRLLRESGFESWLVAHARSRDELDALFPDETRICYIEETRLDRWMWQIGRRMPASIGYLTFGFVARIGVQITQRRLVRRLVAEFGIDVVHQPTPVSPREPSLLHDVGAPVIIGPMNGGMDFPRAFRSNRGTFEASIRHGGRWLAPLLNRLMPGKRKAALLLVANERTREALPGGASRRVELLVENGVELDLWTAHVRPRATADDAHLPTFAFVGRLIELKAVDLLIEALAIACRVRPMRLLVIGDGEQRPALERQAIALFGDAVKPAAGGGPVVRFTGALPQNRCAELLRFADALVLPSLHDCGGAVILEAMAMAMPVIATAWGGPLDYLDASCGILVEPASRQALIDGLAAAMVRLAESPETCFEMGRAAQQRVRQLYDWNVKREQMLGHYRQVQAEHARPPPVRHPSDDADSSPASSWLDNLKLG